jgi:HEAT repeat protein
MSSTEEEHLALWKKGFHSLVSRQLAERNAEIRAAAVTCLGALPIDDAAAPAIAYLNEDDDWRVRLAVLQAFAGRPTLLTADAILPRLHDPVGELAQLAEHLLKGRGLTQEQIGLGRLICHPRANLRASAIPLLLRRSDIDPVVWLIHLSEDKDPGVRRQAVEAFAGRITPEVRQRLEELRASDDSSEVRAAAVRLLPPDTTAALPPLPNSPSLTPRAN